MSVIVGLLKSLLVEQVLKSIALAALDTGLSLIRRATKESTNALTQESVDLLEQVNVIIKDTWSKKNAQ